MKRTLDPSPIPHPAVEQGPTPAGYRRCGGCNTDIPLNQWLSHSCGFFGTRRARAHTECTPVTDDAVVRHWSTLGASEDHQEIEDPVDEVGGSSAGGTAQPHPWACSCCGQAPHVQPSSSQLQLSASQLQPSSSQLQPSSSQLQPSSSQLQPSSSQLQPSSSQLQPSSSQEQLQEQGLQLEAALLASVQGERLSRHDLAFLKIIIERGLSAPAVFELMRTVQRVRAVTLHATCSRT